MASYEKRNNLWSVRFREVVDGREINKRLSGFKTKKEAMKAYKEYTPSVDCADNESSNIVPIYFNELVQLYVDYSKPRMKESSFYSMMSKMNLHILPTFGTLKIAKITPPVILKWQNSLAQYSYKYRSALNVLLSSIFKFGNKYYDLLNPMVKVDPIRNLERKKEMVVWTPLEFERFLTVVDVPLYRLFFRFLYISGCRKGEGLALSYSDIDLEKGTVKIAKSITRKGTQRPFEVTTTKNKYSDRTLAMPREFLQELFNLKDIQSGIFIFGGEKPFADNTLTRKFNEWVQEANVPKIRIHDLRHSCASYLISCGVSVVAVSRRLGHASIAQTLDTYSHIMPSDTEKIVEAFENF